jgi:hypothetical protein
MSFKMTHFLSLVLLVTLSFASIASSSCIAFDASWNLLAFGFGGKDYDAGTQDTWTSGQAKDITTSGRPPFNGQNTTCYLSQFTNAIYVLGADSSNPSSIYIYDASAKSWSTQAVDTNSFDPNSFAAVLDHDTNVFYALSKGELFSLDMGLLKAANSSSLSWVDVQKPSFDTDNYNPVMALAQNHIHFLNVPGVPAGSAIIFVIHFSFLQPKPQSYGEFPATHGGVTSFFKDAGVQEEFAFIPDDGSATYVINVQSNTTQTLKGPSVKDSAATYFASTDALVQLSSSGSVSYLPYNPNSTSSSASATWSVVSKLPSAGGKGNTTGSSTTTSQGASPTKGGSGGSNDASSLVSVDWWMRSVFLTVIAALLL